MGGDPADRLLPVGGVGGLDKSAVWNASMVGLASRRRSFCGAVTFLMTDFARGSTEEQDSNGDGVRLRYGRSRYRNVLSTVLARLRVIRASAAYLHGPSFLPVLASAEHSKKTTSFRDCKRTLERCEAY